MTAYFEETTSPLKYRHDYPVLRLQVVDSSAGPPKAGEAYFAPTVKLDRYDRQGKLRAKPRVKERIPGASPVAAPGHVVGWLDYHYRDPESVSIDHVLVREDARKNAVGAKLVDMLVKQHAGRAGFDGRLFEFDFGKVMSYPMGQIVRKLERAGLNVHARHDYDPPALSPSKGAARGRTGRAENRARNREVRRGVFEKYSFTRSGFQVSTIGGELYLTLFDLAKGLPGSGGKTVRVNDAIGHEVEFEIERDGAKDPRYDLPVVDITRVF